MSNVKFLGLVLIFLSFNSFGQALESRNMHYIFVIDNTTSMLGKTCVNCSNIWEDLKEKITSTISQLDENQNSVISIYTFSGELEARHFFSDIGRPKISECVINQVNKEKINETINAIKATGQETCIYNSFKMLIDKITADDERMLRKYNSRIFLYTDSEEQCRGFKLNCQDAFNKWCSIQSNQDFASIIKLDVNNAASSLLNCISDANCIEVVYEAPTQAIIYIENNPFVRFSSLDLTKVMSFRKSINLDNYPYVQSVSSIRFEVDKCFSLVDESGDYLQEVDVLEHSLSLSGINECKLKSGEIVQGKIIYDRIIYEDQKIKLILLHPEVEFTFVNESIATIKHDYRTE
tara:strand:+ start:741 stop:1790 length:1050 start_codon:yes stop_codon:yes gene_type:complete